jgi:hypothetical protein
MSTLQVNTINESTSGSGVTIDGVKLKDNIVETDTINEKTSTSGVTIDGVLLKDSEMASTYLSDGMVKLQSGTASNSSELVFDQFVDTSKYAGYKFYFYNILAATSNTDMRATFRYGAGAGDIASTHNRGGVAVYPDLSGSTVFGNQSSTNFASIVPACGNGNINAINSEGFFVPTTNSQGVPSIMVDSYFRTHDNYIRNQRTIHIIESNSDAVTGVRFFFGSGNITSGSIHIYGIKY